MNYFLRTGPWILFILLLASCNTKNVRSREDLEKEILEAEKDFEKMAAEKGIAEAFWYFADPRAVIKRANDTLITGKENIRRYYSTAYYTTVKLEWTPDFIAVSDGGDLGWTYGKYRWQSPDSSGRMQESTGVFHTVWKKQGDGSWKYVWD